MMQVIKATPIKCFVSHHRLSCKSGSVSGAQKKKKKQNEADKERK